MSKIRIADIMPNDVVDGTGVCVSLWVQGCPHHCYNCQNPQTWSFNDGEEKDINEVINTIIEAIPQNNIVRNFSVLGGEPLCSENIDAVAYIIKAIRHEFPDISIFVWTGSIYEDLYKNIITDSIYKKSITEIFKNIDILIDGPYVESKKDLTLFLRGSSNQRVIDIKTMRKLGTFDEIILYNK